MIVIVEGAPGAGKTCYAVNVIRNALLAGRRIWTNVPLKVDALRAAVDKAGYEWPDDALTLCDDLYTLIERIPVVRGVGALLVWDEAHEAANSRDYSNKRQHDMLQWFARSRHYGCDCFIISQHANNIDSQWRRLATEYHRLRDLKTIAPPGSLWIAKLIGGSRVSVVDPDETTVLRRDIFRHGPSIWSLYDSYSVDDSANRETLMSGPPKRKKKRAIVCEQQQFFSFA